MFSNPNKHIKTLNSLKLTFICNNFVSIYLCQQSTYLYILGTELLDHIADITACCKKLIVSAGIYVL